MKEIDFNKQWKFLLTDEISGLHQLNTNDNEWENINLPHDWSIRQPYNKYEGEGCTGYLLGGRGWYRKCFETTNEMKDKIVTINFDGIYNRSNIYCNGHFLKFHPYGYSPCELDITEYLNDVGEDNVIAVSVDHTRYADSRWYTGSGIYRKVSINILPKIHIPTYGVYITTDGVTEEKATVNCEIQIQNKSNMCSNNIMQISIYLREKLITTKEINVHIDFNESIKISEIFIINKPILWDIHDSNIYRVEIKLLDNKFNKKQIHNTNFGIRTIKFDVNKGFYLNGKNVLIKGVCLHHEAGLVGAAVPLDVWRRRLNLLIEAGCNAIRTAHNPFSEDFLDLCDELGLLVQEEFYDEWDNPKDKRYNGNEQKVDYITRGHAEFFKDYAKEDLQNVIKRDRNHPSIFQWSIGNEIEWTYPKYNTATGYFGASANGNYFWTLPPYSIEEIKSNIKKLPKEMVEIGTTAKKLADWTREMDATRPVIANCILPSASYESGYVDALDIVGYSYRQVVYEYGNKNYGNKPIMGTENLAQWHEWKHVLEKDYIPGIFLWTGIDYIGEAGNQDVWPRKATRSGLLDLAGFDKPSYHMFKSLWNCNPHIYIATQTLEKSLYIEENGEPVEEDRELWKRRLWVWHDVNKHWNYEEEKVVVEIYSNCEKISLYINEKLISTKKLVDFEDKIYKWLLPYEKGTLKAVGRKGEDEVITYLRTSNNFKNVSLTVDKNEITTNLDEVVHITANLMDENNINITHEEKEIEFILKGCYTLLGVDNGDADNVEPHYNNKVVTKNGRCLLILQGKEKGSIEITAICEGKKSDTLIVSVS